MKIFKLNKKVENKKAIMDEFIRNLLWVILFIVLLAGVGFLLRKILT